MRMQRFTSLFLTLAVSAATSVGSLRADSSVQWGDATADVAVSRSLAWKKPKTSSAVVTPDRMPETAQPIRQVQHLTPPQPPVMTPAQRDLVYPELRPQTNTPPAGAVSTPLTPTNPPSAIGGLPPELPVKPVPNQPAPLKTPLDEPVAPKSGTTPAPSPVDPVTSLPLPTLQSSKEIPCPDTAAFKSIREISYDIRPMPGELPKECPLIAPAYNGRYFGRTCFFWKASALCTKAAYFENVQLERYGHSLCPALEPIFSGVRFFVTIPLLPYQMGLTPPTECVYTLGDYRVGNCAPFMLDPLPVSVRAVLFEAVAVGGAVAIIP